MAISVPMTLLVRWREARNLTLEDACKRLGLPSTGALSDIERGIQMPRPSTILQIFEATGREVTAEDHMTMWITAHQKESVAARTAGWAALKASRKLPAKDKRSHGRKAKNQESRQARR